MCSIVSIPVVPVRRAFVIFRLIFHFQLFNDCSLLYFCPTSRLSAHNLIGIKITSCRIFIIGFEFDKYSQVTDGWRLLSIDLTVKSGKNLTGVHSVPWWIYCPVICCQDQINNYLSWYALTETSLSYLTPFGWWFCYSLLSHD